MDDSPGPSTSKSARDKAENAEENTSDSSSDSEVSSASEKSEESRPSSEKKKVITRVIPVRPPTRDKGHRVNLLESGNESETKSLYQRAKEGIPSYKGKPEIKLPTTSEQYYDLEEVLMNPARMEGRELTLNAYDAVRNKYNVLPGKSVCEADLQKVIGSFSCDVCQELIQGSIMTKKCGHRFCDQCILVAFMRSGNTCPTCRQNLGSKRELQQDPRFDQLIYQVVESRSIVGRMMAENREHEKDVYFGRKGYIEGGSDWNKRYGIDPNSKLKAPRPLKSAGRKKIRWFHESDEDGSVRKVMESKKGAPKEDDTNYLENDKEGTSVAAEKEVLEEGEMDFPIEIKSSDEEQTDLDDEEESMLDSDFEISDNEDVSKPSCSTSKKTTNRSRDSSESDNDSRDNELQKKKRKMKRKNVPKTDGSDVSNESFDEDASGEVVATKLIKESKKKPCGRPKKKFAPELIEGDIPTPSEDSLTSSDEERDDNAADPYAFVFQKEFNRDPRRDGHPEKDKLYNFDFMIDMNHQVDRKFEKDGEIHVISDDSNSEHESDEAEDRESSIDSEHEKEISKFLSHRQPLPNPTSVDDDCQVITVVKKDVKQSAITSKPGETSPDSSSKIEEKPDKVSEEVSDDEMTPEHITADKGTDTFLNNIMEHDDEMYGGYLFRPGDTGISRPKVQRAPGTNRLSMNVCPEAVYVVYPQPVLKEGKKKLVIPPEDYEISSDETVTLSDSEETSPSAEMEQSETSEAGPSTIIKTSGTERETQGSSSPSEPSTSRDRKMHKRKLDTRRRKLADDSDLSDFDVFSIDGNELVATGKPIIKHKVFYDSANRMPSKSNLDFTGRRNAREIPMEEISRLAEEQVAHEEYKIHRRRQVVLEAVEAASKKLNVYVDTTEEEEIEEEETPEEEVVKVASPTAPIATENPTTSTAPFEEGVAMKETPIEEIFFDPDEPCSSAQAAQRELIIERVGKEQQIIEDSLEQNRKPSSKTVKESESREAQEPRIEKDEMESEQQKKDADNPTVEVDKESEASSSESDKSDFEDETLDAQSKTVKISLKHEKTVSDEEIEDFDTKFGEFVATADAKMIKRTIGEYVSTEFLKLVAQQPAVTDEVLALGFCVRNTDQEFSTIKETGKRTNKNPDDVRLESMVKNFRESFAAKHRPVPRKLPTNIERMYIERAHMVKYKHVVDMGPLQSPTAP